MPEITPHDNDMRQFFCDIMHDLLDRMTYPLECSWGFAFDEEDGHCVFRIDKVEGPHGCSVKEKEYNYSTPKELDKDSLFDFLANITCGLYCAKKTSNKPHKEVQRFLDSGFYNEEHFMLGYESAGWMDE